MGDRMHHRQIRLSTGVLLIPGGLHSNGEVNLWVHFHGAPALVRRCFLQTGRNAALLSDTVSETARSMAYRKPFLDPERFGEMLEEAREQVARHFERPLRLGMITVSSFSAGYGALHEILAVPRYAQRIDEVMMFDSLYAGYDEKGRPAESGMAPFLAFARRAAAGEASMVLTHSEEIPDGYAGTTECAGYLIEALGARRVPADGEQAPGFRLISRADLGGFHVLGYAGGSADTDHMNHLRYADLAMRMSSIPPMVPAPSPTNTTLA